MKEIMFSIEKQEGKDEWVVYENDMEKLRVTQEQVWGVGNRGSFHEAWAYEVLKRIKRDGFERVAWILTGDKKYSPSIKKITFGENIKKDIKSVRMAWNEIVIRHGA